MNDSRLNCLAILNIKALLATSLNHDVVVQDVARSKMCCSVKL